MHLMEALERRAALLQDQVVGGEVTFLRAEESLKEILGIRMYCSHLVDFVCVGLHLSWSALFLSCRLMYHLRSGMPSSLAPGLVLCLVRHRPRSSFRSYASLIRTDVVVTALERAGRS